MTFKRTTVTLASGDYRANNALRGADFLTEQPVTIVADLGEDDDGEDTFRVQTFSGYKYDVTGSDLSPHPHAPETNVEFITRMMEWGPSALIQPFVLQAIEQFAKVVLKAPAKAPEEDNGIVSDAAWRQQAQYVLGQFVARDVAEQERRRAA